MTDEKRHPMQKRTVKVEAWAEVQHDGNPLDVSLNRDHIVRSGYPGHHLVKLTGEVEIDAPTPPRQWSRTRPTTRMGEWTAWLNINGVRQFAAKIGRLTRPPSETDAWFIEWRDGDTADSLPPLPTEEKVARLGELGDELDEVTRSNRAWIEDFEKRRDRRLDPRDLRAIVAAIVEVGSAVCSPLTSSRIHGNPTEVANSIIAATEADEQRGERMWPDKLSQDAIAAAVRSMGGDRGARGALIAAAESKGTA